MPFIVATIIMEGRLHNNTGTCLHVSGEEYMQYMRHNVLSSYKTILKKERPPFPDLCNQKDDHQFICC